MPRIAPQPPISEDFPVPCNVFARTLVGTDEEVWIKLLNNVAGQLNLKPAEWRKKLESLKG